MYVINTSDVNDALCRGIEYLLREGVEEDSRNGKVLVAPGLVTTEYLNPRRRVLFSATRDANPWFHVFESLMFLAGDNRLDVPCYFVKNYAQYSDDGITMWDSYGWRWRQFFGWDQIEAIIAELKRDPASRRCVLSMWNAMEHDFSSEEVQAIEWTDTTHSADFAVGSLGGKAIPCNTHAYLDCRGGALNMTVCNRSNDIIFGCYGANVVHMSFLLEYMAMRIGVPVGIYRQMSNNFHAYLDVFSRSALEQIAYESDTLGALPSTGPALEPGFDEDLAAFMPWARHVMALTDHSVALAPPALHTAFMTTVAAPMFLTWVYRKWKYKYGVDLWLAKIDAPYWRRACDEWIQRRQK